MLKTKSKLRLMIERIIKEEDDQQTKNRLTQIAYDYDVSYNVVSKIYNKLTDKSKIYDEMENYILNRYPGDGGYGNKR